MTLRSRCTRALSSLSFASLANHLTAPRLLRAAGVGLLGASVFGVADASRVSHFTHSTRLAHAVHHSRHGRRAAAQPLDTLSAGSSSGLLTPPASNLQSVLNPTTSIATAAANVTEPAGATRYSLHLHHTHTNEDIDVVYRIGNYYIPSAIAKLNYFLRDHRTMDVSHYDPREFDLLHSVLASLGRPHDVIDIVCGYRTPWSNNYLRTRSAVTGVAKNSQHMQAKAIDIRIPGVSTSRLRDIALGLHGGGVGYYPVSQFVHVDVGPVRQWSFGGRGE